MRKGQGATEYLVLLAVVLVIALVSIALLGFFPGLATDARITQSRSYWQSASPIAITETILSGTTLTLVLQNNGPDPISIGVDGITTVSTEATPTTESGPLAAKTLGPGGRLTLASTDMPVVVGGVTCALNTVYEFNVEIDYGTPTLAGQTQRGSKTLAVKCT